MTSLYAFSCFFLILPLLVKAQIKELPFIESQYLYQAKNSSTPILNISYTNKQAHILSPTGTIAFSQANIAQLLTDKQRTTPSTANLLSANVCLHAPNNLPIHYINDLIFWLRIGGCQTLYLAVNAAQTSTVQYLHIPITPFALSQQGYNNLAAAQQAHPNTHSLASPFEWDWYFEQLKNHPMAYVPSLIFPINFREGQIFIDNETINPLLLSTWVQTQLAQQYQNSYQKATPASYLGINISLERNASYQHFIDIVASVLEGYHLYWEDLAFAKYQQTYLELPPSKRWELQQAAPLLPFYYDAVQNEKLNMWKEQKPLLWSELNR